MTRKERICLFKEHCLYQKTLWKSANIIYRDGYGHRSKLNESRIPYHICSKPPFLKGCKYLKLKEHKC